MEKDLIKFYKLLKSKNINLKLSSNKILIIGNGPSTDKIDFPNTIIDTIGMNAAYRYWNKIFWYPTYYFCLDDKVILSHSKEIYNLIANTPIKLFFLHDNIKKTHPDLINNNKVLFISEFHDFNRGKTNKIYSDYNILDTGYLTTGSFSIRFSILMGYDEIFTIGIDCNYVNIIEGAKQVDNLKLIIESKPDKNPNYFFDDYQKKGDVYNIPNYSDNVHLMSVNKIVKYINDNDISINIYKLVDSNQDINFKYFNLENFTNLYINKPIIDVVTTMTDEIQENVLTSLKLNLKNLLIKKIHILLEPKQFKNKNNILELIIDKYGILLNNKIVIKLIDSIPSYYDIINFINTNNKINGIVCIINSDIALTNSFELLNKCNFNGYFVCLTRYNIKNDKLIVEGYRNIENINAYSFDTYIFKKPLNINKDIEDCLKYNIVGKFQCDTILSSLMKISGYKVINLYDKLITVHYDDAIKSYRTNEWCENRNKKILNILKKNNNFNNLTHEILIENGKTYNYFDKYIFIKLNSDMNIEFEDKFNFKKSGKISKLIILNKSLFKPKICEILNKLNLEDLHNNKVYYLNQEEYLCYLNLYSCMKKKLF